MTVLPIGNIMKVRQVILNFLIATLKKENGTGEYNFENILFNLIFLTLCQYKVPLMRYFTFLFQFEIHTFHVLSL